MNYEGIAYLRGNFVTKKENIFYTNIVEDLCL
jgi:hypothetical protein